MNANNKKKQLCWAALKFFSMFDPEKNIGSIWLIFFQTFSILNAMSYRQAYNKIKDYSTDKEINKTHKHTEQHSNTPKLIIADG